MSVLQGSGYAATVTGSSAPAASAATLTVTAPDLSTSTPAVVSTGAPTFTSVVPATLVGTYQLVWTLTGAGATEVVQDQFTSESAASAATLTSLSRVKTDLNKVNDTSKDVKLRQWLR